MNIFGNKLVLSDSYKITHWSQIPEGTTNMYSYFESRGGLFPEVVFFGLQYYLKTFFATPITMEDIDDAEELFKLHLGDYGAFNRAGWERIVKVHGGYLPLRIKAVPEGMVVPTRNVLMTFENTDDELPWLTGYMETVASLIWYSCTVATLSREIKKVIKSYLEKTGDVSLLPFKLHDFGARGTSSIESAGIGGTAHLVNFMGTDTMAALLVAKKIYHEPMAGFSIPAMEHSTVTIWGKEREPDAYLNTIKRYGQEANCPAVAIVGDSYDIFNMTRNIIGDELKKYVDEMKNTLVVRPDSGIPHVIVVQIVETLAEKFGYTTNEKGFKVLNKVRVIQGDGINYEEIKTILEALYVRGWSADNIAFGMGGALLQRMDRDTQKFAFKCSSAVVNGQVRDVFKAPVTDHGKRSKAGRLKLIYKDGVLETVRASEIGHDVLQTVYENGKILVDTTLTEIRQRAEVK